MPCAALNCIALDQIELLTALARSVVESYPVGSSSDDDDSWVHSSVHPIPQSHLDRFRSACCSVQARKHDARRTKHEAGRQDADSSADCTARTPVLPAHSHAAYCTLQDCDTPRTALPGPCPLPLPWTATTPHHHRVASGDTN